MGGPDIGPCVGPVALIFLDILVLVDSEGVAPLDVISATGEALGQGAGAAGPCHEGRLRPEFVGLAPRWLRPPRAMGRSEADDPAKGGSFHRSLPHVLR